MARRVIARLISAAVVGPLAAGFLSAGFLSTGVAAAERAAVPTADGVPDVLVVIDSLTPLVPGPAGQLTVRGRVVSTAREPLSDVSVVLRRSAAPLSGRAQVGEVAEAPMSADEGDPDDVVLTGTTVTVADTLPPGDAAPFQLSLPLASAGFTEPGAYVLGVEASGRLADEASPRRLGAERTFLPWFPADVTPIRLAWLWPLAAPADRTASGVLLSVDIPESISPGGRLFTLVDVGRRYPEAVSWIVDPALLQTVADLGGGYQVRVDGGLIAGDRESQARAWLDQVSAVAAATGVRTLPYADIDASAAVRAGMSADVVRAVTSGPGVAAAALGEIAPGGLAWSPFPRLDPQALSVLSSAGTVQVVVPSSALRPADPGMPVATVPTGQGTVSAVLADPGLARAISLPQRTPAEILLARQQFLAETAVLATGPGGAYVVAPETTTWDPARGLLIPLLRALRTAPWLQEMTLAEILAEPAGTRTRAGYGARARAEELPAGYMASVERLSSQVTSFVSILDNPVGVTEPFSAAILRSQSAAWRPDLPAGEALVRAVGAELSADMDRVRVLSAGTITFSGDTGRIPVTITNDLDRAVTVGLALRGQPDRRLESQALTGIVVPPGRMTSVDLTARVIGGEPLTVEVQLIDGAGGDYGEPSLIELRSTAYARAAAWVVAVAFAAILVFVVVGVIRRIHRARATPAVKDLGR